MSRIKITYTRDPLQFCNIRDCQPKQKVHKHKCHEQDEDQEKHLFGIKIFYYLRRYCQVDLCQGGRLGVFDEICCEVKLAHEHGQNLCCQYYGGKVVPMTTKHISHCSNIYDCDLDEAVIQGSKCGGSGQKVFLKCIIVSKVKMALSLNLVLPLNINVNMVMVQEGEGSMAIYDI